MCVCAQRSKSVPCGDFSCSYSEIRDGHGVDIMSCVNPGGFVPARAELSRDCAQGVRAGEGPCAGRVGGSVFFSRGGGVCVGRRSLEQGKTQKVRFEFFALIDIDIENVNGATGAGADGMRFSCGGRNRLADLGPGAPQTAHADLT